MGLLPYPDQDRSVKAHRAANPIPVSAPEGVSEELVAEEIIEVEGVETEIVEAESVEVVEEPVAVGAGDPEDSEA
jgi:hypothetical protein